MAKVLDMDNVKEFINIISSKDIILFEFLSHRPLLICFKNITDVYFTYDDENKPRNLCINYTRGSDGYGLTFDNDEINHFININKKRSEPNTKSELDPVEKINSTMEDFTLVDS
jgi:hypothetical protein